jgi:galactokinase
MTLTPANLRARFRARFGSEPRLFSAPGRVNLIGEHTDYNDGFVLPVALDRRTYVAAAKRPDRLVRVYASDLDKAAEFALGTELQPVGDWSDYLRGVAACLERDWFTLCGADLLIASEVPLGAGLSSSAALEAAVGYALVMLAEQSGNLLDLALILQKAEHEFVGTKCGVMDQYIACLGQAGHALLIDCRTLGCEAVPLDLRETRLVVANTLVKHELATSQYNLRRAECEEGVRRLAQHLPGIRALRDVELVDFDPLAALLPDAIRRRCNHVINENARVALAVAALKQNNLALLGKLMFASHESLRYDYEVSCPELDALVELAAQLPGVYGARMTGGGFGGCTINLVEAEHLENFLAQISQGYEKLFGAPPELYSHQIGEGVKEHV